MTGGHYDVDVVLKNPNGEILYDEKKKQYDSHTFDSKIPGENFDGDVSDNPFLCYEHFHKFISVLYVWLKT